MESGILESWNLGILESWNLGILESYHITNENVNENYIYYIYQAVTSTGHLIH